MRLYLSHSGADKYYVVEPLVGKIGMDRLVYVDWAFEEGLKTKDEIHRTLGESDIFVILLSNKALKKMNCFMQKDF